MSILFCILGRSGVGKDTLVNQVCKNLSLNKVVSHTTRAPRYGEKQGVNYYFAERKNYFDDLDEGYICASTKIGDNYYWTNRADIRHKDIYVIDPLGLQTLQKYFSNNSEMHIVSIYITAPVDQAFARGYARSPSDYEKFKQKCNDENVQFKDFEAACNYDYCVHNVHFDIAIKQLETIIQHEREKYEI